MHKIGIIGHSPEHFSDNNLTKRCVEQTIDLLLFQYGHDDVLFNIVGEIGIGLWASEFCLKNNIKYHLYIPFVAEETSKHWFNDQKEVLKECLSKAYAITISNPVRTNDFSEKEFKQMVDDSIFLVCFWNGKKQGRTYDSINYAMNSSKLVISAFDGLKLVTRR